MFSQSMVHMVVDPETLQAYPIIAGGDETEVIEEGAETGEEGGERGGQGREPMIPKYRLDAVSKRNAGLEAELKKYRAYGLPDELDTKLKRFEKLASGRSMTDDEIKAVEAELKQVPAIARMLERQEREEKERTEEGTRFLEKAKKHSVGYLKDLGLEPKEEAVKTRLVNIVQAAIAEVIRMDDDMYARWRRNDLTVMDDAFKLVKGELFSGLRRSQGAEKQRLKQGAGERPGERGKPPAQPKGKAEAEDAPIDERAILKKAADRGFARLQQMGEEE